jgi:hypothetical protein
MWRMMDYVSKKKVYVSPNVGGWENLFLVDVWITNSIFESKWFSLATPSVETSPTFASFFLGVLSQCLVIGFLGGIFL